jgi:hypothetical protein
VLAWLAGCAGNPPSAPAPFQPAEEMRQRGVRSIALAPLRVESGVVDAARARAELEPRITARLVAAGFAVVPSEEYERLWRATAGEVGSVWDPVTGKLDRARFDAVEASVQHELRVRLQADAVLRTSVVAAPFYLPGPTLWFYGTSELLYWPPAEAAFTHLERATYAVASCLELRLVDLEERELYVDRGGLETIETYARQTRAERPFEERMRDPERLDQAVDYAITALTGPAAH